MTPELWIFFAGLTAVQLVVIVNLCWLRERFMERRLDDHLIRGREQLLDLRNREVPRLHRALERKNKRILRLERKLAAAKAELDRQNDLVIRLAQGPPPAAPKELDPVDPATLDSDDQS